MNFPDQFDFEQLVFNTLTVRFVRPLNLNLIRLIKEGIPAFVLDLRKRNSDMKSGISVCHLNS